MCASKIVPERQTRGWQAQHFCADYHHANFEFPAPRGVSAVVRSRFEFPSARTWPGALRSLNVLETVRPWSQNGPPPEPTQPSATATHIERLRTRISSGTRVMHECRTNKSRQLFRKCSLISALATEPSPLAKYCAGPRRCVNCHRYDRSIVYSL